jgi:hypothetical protein
MNHHDKTFREKGSSMNTRHLSLTLLTLATIQFVPLASQAQSLLQVDFGAGANRLQPGFTSVTGAVSEPSYFNTVGPYSVMLEGDGFFGTGGNAGNIGAGVRGLYRDYYYNNSTANGDGIVLTLGGFTPGTPYDVTLWSYDADQTFTVTPTEWVGFADSPSTASTINMFATPYPTTQSDFSTTLQLTSTSGTLSIFGTTTGGSGGTRLNGVRVSSAGSELLALDFGQPDAPVSPVQTGYIGINGDVANPNVTQSVGAYTVGLQGQGFFQTTSGNADLIDVGVRDFYRDYYYNNATENGQGITLSIDGVTPNTDYDLTLWSYDADNFSPTPTTWTPTGNSSGNVGNVTNVQSPYPVSTGEYSTTVRIRSTTSTLEVFGTTTGGTGGTRLNGFQLSVAAASLPGDFDGDLMVDGDDLTIWTTNFGATSGASTSTGDADDDDDVDGADFLIWQRNLGLATSMAVGSVVPEPTSPILCMLAGLGIASARRLRRGDF